MSQHVPEDLLQDFVDGEVGEQLAVHIAEHIDACPSCATRAAGLEPLAAAFAAVRDPVPPPTLVASILARLDEPDRVPIPEIGIGVSLLLAAGLIVAANSRCCAADDAAKGNENESLTIFQQRILPIFQSPKPSSCAECHLSGVDLKDYIREDQQQTFASLVAAGMVDVKAPDKSKILAFIRRAPEKPSLIGEKTRKLEYEAFRAWIRAAVEDPQLLAAKDAAAPIGPRVGPRYSRQ